MLIIGAKGHAVEILDVLTKNNMLEDLFFYDDISEDLGEYLFDRFNIIKSSDEAERLFERDRRYILGLGNPELRYRMVKKFNRLGGILTSVVSSDASVGRWGCTMETGVNIMAKTFISSNTTICEGVLINAGSQVHHGTYIGRYSEISPNVSVAGNCRVGEFCSIGIGAVLLPGIHIGNNAVVGAGSVVTGNVPENEIVYGVPAKSRKKR